MLPGFTSPAAGFDSPFEMLTSCHERVQRSLRLLLRLGDHLRTHPCDEPARQAARDVLRYFDQAAPLHHEDEERHVFPRVLGGGDAALAATVRQLQADHARMEAGWQAVRGELERIAGDRDGSTRPGADSLAVWQGFADLYGEHITLEETQVYPAAQALTPPEALAAMGADMAARRGAVAR